MPFEYGTDGPDVVVAGVDGSRTSLRAAAWAAGLARRQGSRLVAVYVLDGRDASGLASLSGLGPEAALAAADTKRQLAAELAGQAHERSQADGLDVEFVALRGDPFTELTRLADERRADLVVVGASESTGHRFVGSLAVRLVRAGRWPVTVVP